MRLVIITQNEYIYLPNFFRSFFSEIKETKVSTEKIYLVPPLDKSITNQITQGYQFYGLRNFLTQGTKRLFLQLSDRLGLNRNSVKSIAKKNKVSVRHCNDINSKILISRLKKLEPHIILSVSSPQIFKKELLQVPSWGCINVHSAKLPKYRGRMPNFWAMHNGDDKAGITIHTMERELDRGNIVLQDEVEIEPNDTLDSLIKKSKAKAGRLTAKALHKIEKGEEELTAPQGPGCYKSFPTEEDIKEFRKRGNQLI